MDYDIIQVEDDPDHREFISSNAVRCTLTYLCVGSLKELERVLQDNNARVWLVDGLFPEEEGGAVLYNAPRAIDTIRETYPDARILLFSSYRRAQKTAEEMGVDFKDKGRYLARDLVEEIKAELG